MAKLHYALFLLVSFISLCNADIKTLSLNSNPRPVIVLHKFAFNSFGGVSISVSDVSIEPWLYRAELSRLGFFLLSDEASIQLVRELKRDPSLCILDALHVKTLFTFRELPLPPHSFFNKTYSFIPPGEYSLLYANCNPEARVSMKVHSELYNIDFRGSRNYLSHGQSRLIPLFFQFSLAYLFLLVLWAYYCYCNKETTNRVHHLITGLITAKTLGLICAGLDMYYLKLTGLHHGWDILFKVAQVMSSLIITALIIIGLLVFKQFLSKKEAKVWIVPIAFQVLSNLASPFAVMMVATAPSVVFGFALLDMICTCTILLAVGWSIWMLKEAAKTDEKTAMRLAKIKEFALLYYLAITYLYVVPVVAISLRFAMAQRYEWVSNAVEEVAHLAIYVVTLCIFWPVNNYTLLDEQNENEETEAVANEETQV